MQFPESFKHTVIGLHGEEGVAWLARLPALLQHCGQRWDLTLGEPFAYASCHYVTPATRADGTQVVLKLHSPTDEFAQEAAALRHYAGRGAVRLLDADDQNAILLLERLRPGSALIQLTDDVQATAHAITVMRQLWHPAPVEHPFPTIDDWAQGLTRLRQRFHGGTGPLPTHLVEEAETLYSALRVSGETPVVLHGDLHHENILAAEREPWLAIDPKGVVGEPAYETGAWLRNPISQLRSLSQPDRVLARRIDQFAAELGLDRARIRAWALYQAVLSAWWCIEDNGQVDPAFVAFIQVIADLKIA